MTAAVRLQAPCARCNILNNDALDSTQMVLSTVGAAYGTSKAGIGISGLGTFRWVRKAGQPCEAILGDTSSTAGGLDVASLELFAG